MTWVLAVDDESGTRREVALVDGTLGYPCLVVEDELGVEHEIPNFPEESPPVGELEVYDEGGTQRLIAFESPLIIHGLYERSTNAVRTAIDGAVSSGVMVQWDNSDKAPPSPTGSTLWAMVRVEVGPEEHSGFGAGNRYQLTGEAVIELRCPTQIADAAVLDEARAIKAALRDATSDNVRFDEPWHVTVQRDGAWWKLELHLPWRAEHEQDIPTTNTAGYVALDDLHDVVRSEFLSRVATPQGLTTFWDNSASAPADVDVWCIVHVLTGRALAIDHGAVRTRRVPGVMKATLFVRLGVSDAIGWRMVDALADSFRAASAAGVSFGAPTARRIGRRGRAWLISVDVPFRADELA